MIKSVDISKRAEAYVRFAYWCNDHKMGPYYVAECITLCRDASNPKNRRKRSDMIQQVVERLEKSGATNIVFEYGWPQFTSPIGESTSLPIRRFT